MSIIKKLKVFFYQKLMRMFSLKYFEGKKIAAMAKLKKAREEKIREKEKENIAFAIARKSLEVLNKNEWKKIEDMKKHQKNLKKVKLHQDNKITAQQKVEQAEKEIRFLTLMIEMKEKMKVMSKQRKMHKRIGTALKKEEIRIAKNMAQASVV